MDEIQAGMKPPDDPGAHGGGGGEGASGGDVTVRPPRPKFLYEEDFDYEHYKVLVQPEYSRKVSGPVSRSPVSPSYPPLIRIPMVTYLE
ncbi:hypothetical protein M8J76_004170 [Diaphorina citri]|nr:hypothetical protein M8J76_004170 [Diaphorina citri]